MLQHQVKNKSNPAQPAGTVLYTTQQPDSCILPTKNDLFLSRSTRNSVDPSTKICYYMSYKHACLP